MKKIILVIGFMFAFHSSAGILIEPYLGYALNGNGDLNTGSPIETSYSALTLGGRVGYGMMGFGYGLDYSIATFYLESKNRGSTTSHKEEVSRDDLAIFVSYDFPMMLRVWGKYIFNSKIEGKDRAADGYEEGGGIALGVGWTGLPFVSVNLEYRKIEYDKIKSSRVNAIDYNEKLDMNDILLSVSLPLDL